MKSYACPTCGRESESAESGTSFLAWPRCPTCNTPLELSGGMLIVVGLLGWIFFSLFLCDQMETLGLLIAIPLCVLGLLRLRRHGEAAKAQKELLAELPEDPASDGPEGSHAP